MYHFVIRYIKPKHRYLITHCHKEVTKAPSRPKGLEVGEQTRSQVTDAPVGDDQTFLTTTEKCLS